MTSLMFSMNAVNHTWVQGVKGAHVKKMNEIKPNTAMRLAFIDEGFMTPDAYAVCIALSAGSTIRRSVTGRNDRVLCGRSRGAPEVERHRYHLAC